jgi:hypothetical protein
MPRNKEKLGWGGRRKGAGRKPNPGPRKSPHRTRPTVTPELPVLVKLRTLPHVPSLQGKKIVKLLSEMFAAAHDRLGAHILDYSVRAHAIAILVQATDETVLMRAMKGLSVRIARGLNRHTGDAGKVMFDRYQVKVLPTRAEAERVIGTW